MLIRVGKLRTAAVPGAQMQLMRSVERLKRQPGQKTLSFMHQIKGFCLGFMATIASGLKLGLTVQFLFKKNHSGLSPERGLERYKTEAEIAVKSLWH